MDTKYEINTPSGMQIQNLSLSYFSNIFVFRISRAKARSGQAMLVAILMITAAALAIGLAIAAIGSSQVNITLVNKQSSQAYALAEGCLENTLMRMARTNNTPPPVFTTSQGSCTIEISGSAPAPYQIISTGQVGKAFRKIRATVSINNEILTINSWQESY